jgi:glycosyltransferase involved in cell wall biosynthesis
MKEYFRLHICMITSEFPPTSGGVGYFVYHLSKKLVERRHRVTVITRGSASKTKIATVEGFKVFKVPFIPFYPFHVLLLGKSVNKLFQSMESEFDVVHLHTPMPLPIKTSLPTITTVHTPMKIDVRYHEISNFYSLAERVQSMVVYPLIESKLFTVSKMITSVSWSVAEELREYGLNPNHISVVGNGVDEKAFSPSPNRKPAETYVLYTGVLRGRKGLFDLIACAGQVCEVFSDVRFFVCGRGPFLRDLECKVRKMGLQRRIVFLGYVERDKLIQIYQNATIQVVPSYYEGLPTVLLEAMSCGLPVVATNIGGNNEVISSGLNGFLVPPRRPEEMADSILKLLADSTLRERIGRAARETIEKRYTWDKIADNIVKCYESLLS